jgi:hypothetical protein
VMPSLGRWPSFGAVRELGRAVMAAPAQRAVGMGAGSGFVLATVWRLPDNAPPQGTRANGRRSEGFGGGCLQLVSESLELHTPEQNTATQLKPINNPPARPAPHPAHEVNRRIISRRKANGR